MKIDLFVLKRTGRFLCQIVVLKIVRQKIPLIQHGKLLVGLLPVIDFLIAKFTGIKASPFGKGFVGFVLSAVILYVTQYFVAGYVISWMAAIIGALIYGVVDYFLPGDQEM